MGLLTRSRHVTLGTVSHRAPNTLETFPCGRLGHCTWSKRRNTTLRPNNTRVRVRLVLLLLVINSRQVGKAATLANKVALMASSLSMNRYTRHY